ncbi:MAG: ATP-dependent 6-phosphofructokinase [bacterium]
MLTEKDFRVKTLGDCMITSPLKYSTIRGDGLVNFVPDNRRIRYYIDYEAPVYKRETREDGNLSGCPLTFNDEQQTTDDKQNEFENCSFEKAGPRSMVYFQPAQVIAAIMTSGGLCPGLNNVIRSLVMELYYRYGVKKILGIRYGHKGLDPSFSYEPIELNPAIVSRIHETGGSFIGTSRGTVDKEVMAESLMKYKINILFGVGGDGSQKGLHQLSEASEKRGLKISFVGIPKTIDNDIPYAYKTFGLSTAVTIASEATASAHSEAESAHNGIGLVKLMGRNSGYIAALTTIANNDVNFCLVPEADFDLDGEGGFLDVLERRLIKRHHAVIVVAEGAGQKYFENETVERDASGNVRLKDIGFFLREKIKGYFLKKGIHVDLKYIEPSYMIRSVQADADDSIYTDSLARNAVHAGMAGKTDVLVGNWYNMLTYVPLSLVVSRKKRLDIEGDIWRSVLSATGQPLKMIK